MLHRLHDDDRIVDDDAWFTTATFRGDARFTSTSFHGDAWFNYSTLPNTRFLDDGGTRWPGSDFRGATFARGAPADVEQFVSAPKKPAEAQGPTDQQTPSA